jgi:hypothetical protein
MKTSMFFALLLVLAATGLPERALGTTVLYADLPGLVKTSSLVFFGRVDSVTTRNLAGDERAHIVTDVSFTVKRVLKGTTPGPQFDLRLVGGTWGNRSVLISGQPKFSKDEEVVLFLEWTGSTYAICGLKQGKYSVMVDREGRRWAQRSLAGLNVMVRTGKAAGAEEATTSAGQPAPDGREIRPGQEEPPVLLDELFETIRNLVDEE